MKEEILEVKKVTKRFGGVIAVDKISFTLYKNEVLGIIGPNGSGKTTLANIITGYIKPDSGKIFYKGEDITGKPPHVIANMGIARTFQVPRPFYRLPAYKNLIVPLYSNRAKKIAYLGGKGERGYTSMDILEDLGFERDSPVPYKPAAALPHGYLKRLELARCLAINPDIIIMDEIFSGLSSAEIISMIPIIEKLNIKGLTLILIEHRLKELFKLVNRVIVLDYGRIIAEESPEEIVRDKKVLKAYLGEEVV